MIKVKFFANNFDWAKNQLLEVEKEFALATQGALQFKIDLEETNLDPVWTGTPNPVYIDDNWFFDNITSRANGFNISILALKDYPPKQGGTNKPIHNGISNIELRVYEENRKVKSGKKWLVFVLCHEILHTLFQWERIASGESKIDQTHIYMQNSNPKWELDKCLSFINLNTINKYLKGEQLIKIRQIGWSDKEKGLYIPFDTLERQKGVIDNFTKLFSDYTLDPNEYNLGERPF